MVLVYLILLLVVICALKLLLFHRKMSFAKVLPVIEPHYPLIGNALIFVGQSDEARFRNIARGLAHPAKLFRYMVTIVPLICTSDPEITQIILTKCFEKPFLYDFFKLDYGLFAAHYDIWKNQRKALNSTFNLRILHSFIPIFDKCAQNLMARLGSITQGQVINVTEQMLRCALESVTATTIGIDVNKNRGADRLTALISRGFFLASKRLVRIHWYLDWMYKLTRDYREDVKLRAEGYSYLNEILQDAVDRKSSKNLSVTENSGQDCEEYRKPQIFVDQLLDSLEDKKFTDIEIIHNVYTMIVAGSDTTGTELGYVSLMLALHPDLQERVYQETIKVFPLESNTPFTPESLKQLTYTEMFLNECLRLYPMGPQIARKTTSEIELDGLKIPAGIMLVVSIYNMHRRKDIWGPNADSFDPEHFSEERCAERHPFAFLPFSGGARNCIGSRYAMISMKIVMVHLLRNFTVKTHWKQEDLRFRFETLLKTTKQPEIYLERRGKDKNI